MIPHLASGRCHGGWGGKNGSMTPLKKIIIGLFSASILSLLLVGFYLTSSLEDALFRQWRDGRELLVGRIAAEIDSELSQARQRLLDLAARPEFRTPLDPDLIDRRLNGIPEGADQPRRKALDWLLHERDHGFSALFVLLPNGDHYMSHPFTVQKSLKQYNLSTRPYFQAATRSRKPVISDSFPGADGVPAVAIDIPVLGEQGQILSHLGGVFHLSDLTRLIQSPDLSRGGSAIFLLDSQGRLLSENNHLTMTKQVTALIGSAFVEDFLQFSNLASSDDSKIKVAIVSPAGREGKQLAMLVRLANGWILGTTTRLDHIVSGFFPGILQTVAIATLLMMLAGGSGLFLLVTIGRRWQMDHQLVRYARDELEALVAERTAQIKEKEQEVSITLDSIGEALISVDSHGFITRMNPAAEWMTGWSQLSAKGQPLADILNINVFSSAGLRDEPRGGEAEGSGTFRLDNCAIETEAMSCRVTLTAAPIRDDTGSEQGTVFVFRDVTTDYLNQRALKASEVRAREFAEIAADMFWETGPDGRFSYLSGRVETVLGLSEEYIMGRFWKEVYLDHGDIDSLEFKDLQPQLPSRQTFSSVVVPWRMSNGELRYISLSGRPLFNEDGVFLGHRGVSRDVTSRVQSEIVLRENEEKFRAIFQASGKVMIVVVDQGGNIVEWNHAAAKGFGYTADEIIGKQLSVLLPANLQEGHGREFLQAVVSCCFTDHGKTHALTGVRKGGEKFPLELTLGSWEQNGTTFFSAIMFDITERRQSEQALRIAQKMEAIGQMAGGIAHDFNNSLSVIMGNLYLLKAAVGDREEPLKRLDLIDRAAQRASDLTRKLLGFSRKKVDNAKVVNINHLLKEMEPLISRSAAMGVETDYQLADNLWSVEVDASDFENALLNLVLNARDAMPNGGNLSFETKNCTLDEVFCAENTGARAGSYVELVVRDTGAGISPELQRVIFEPFFTTKPMGEGTGLGLAMVFSFVKRSDGYIKVNSDVGFGTSFHLFLPMVQKAGLDVCCGLDEPLEDLPRGDETVLIVDDNVDVLEITSQFLALLGYRTLKASSSLKALEILAATPDVALLLSDVVMNGPLDGKELARLAGERYQDLRILFMSGFVPAGKDEDLFFSEVQLLRKPFNQTELAKKVRNSLDT